MKRKTAVLRLTVGEPMESSLARAATAMKGLEHRKRVKPFFGVGFDDIGAMFPVFTPKRWIFDRCIA